MQRTIKILILMILSILITFSVNAEGTTSTMNLKQSVAEVFAGEQFTVTLSVTSETGINGILGKVTYDKDEVELVKVEEAGSSWFNFGSGEKIEVINRTDSTDIKSGDIIKATFKVKDGLEAGTKIKVGVADMQLSTLDKEEYDNLGSKDVEVVVKEETPAGTDDPEDPAGTDDPEDPAGSEEPGDSDDPASSDDPAGSNDEKKSAEEDDKTDTTQADKDFPDTGVEKLIIPAIIIAVLGTAAYIGNKKYKNI